MFILSSSAARLGTTLTGLLAPFPLYGTILAVFAQRQIGATAAIGVLRGLLFGLFSFASFFLVLAELLLRVSTGWAFSIALATALATQGLVLLVLWQQK